MPSWLKSGLKARTVPTLAALHDVGKISPGFQCRCESWLKKTGLREQAIAEGWATAEQDHAKVTQFTVQRMLANAQLWKWAAILGAHHGSPKGLHIAAVTECGSFWQAERQKLADEIVRVFGPLPQLTGDEAALWFQAGLICTADWLGSNEAFFPLHAQEGMSDRRHRARNALESIGWTPLRVRSGLSFHTIFDAYSPNPLQSATVDTVRDRGLYVIEGPMGVGKTEAALAASYQLIERGKATGIYFALPTQVTSNRIHHRVRCFLENCLGGPSVLRLAHSGSWLSEDDQPLILNPSISDLESTEEVRIGRSWFASAKRALLAPFGVGTIDQALLGIVAAKHFFVRQYGLAGKVVILDEVHSYDLYTGTLIDVLIRRLLELQCTVIVLSATLTEARRRTLLQIDEDRKLSDAYPVISAKTTGLIEVPCAPPKPKHVAVRFTSGPNLIEECLDRAEQGQCVLWIHNTVDDAQHTYRTLKSMNREGGPELGLLHSRFPVFRREELEENWMGRLGRNTTHRPHGCVLVSTQVAEQSVDIDADLLVTELAPTDMLLQRIGRLWRHERNRPADWKAEVWIRSCALTECQLSRASAQELRQSFGKTARIYAPYILLRSYCQWHLRQSITLPTDIRAVLEATYAEAPEVEPEAWVQLREELEDRKGKLAAQALSATNVWTQPSLKDEDGVQTRFSSYPTASLLLARSVEPMHANTVRLHLLDGEAVEASDREWRFKTAKGLHRNLVRIPRWAMLTGLLRPPGWLANHVTEQAALGLLARDGDIRWPGNVAETGLSYDREQGIVIDGERMPRKLEEEEGYDECCD